MNYNGVVKSDYGPVIVNRYDANQTGTLQRTGKAFDHEDIMFLCDLAKKCGEGVVCVDIGANFGLFTLALAKAIEPLGGHVISYEGQRILAYMIAGTISLNSLQNAYVYNFVMGKEEGSMAIPQYDYNRAGNFGSFEFKPKSNDIGQERLPDNPDELVRIESIDALSWKRLDLIKIDAEGMEEEILAGGIETFTKFKPIAWVEWLKSDKGALVRYFKKLGYNVYEHEYDLFCIQPNQFPELQESLTWARFNL
jgi:FkbM family methyltransferase